MKLWVDCTLNSSLYGRLYYDRKNYVSKTPQLVKCSGNGQGRRRMTREAAISSRPMEFQPPPPECNFFRSDS
jgi:hypothetical protein